MDTGETTMRRRDFLAMAAMMANSLAVRATPARERQPLVRGAVVIGVNKTGNLPILDAAAAGARGVAAWLLTEGFEVELLTDDREPVVAAKVKTAVAKFVERGTLDQLLVYFSGHGFISGYAEYWMLSNAPQDADEAISLRESLELARAAAIPSVVFISDACRSRADSLGAERMHGSVVFPNTGPSGGVPPEVDQFLASLVGNPALEVPVGSSTASFQGLYTSAFLDAFKDPGTDMVRSVEGVAVVPDRSLKPYLAREVPKRAQAKSIMLSQVPDSRVESDYTTYLGRAVFTSSERRTKLATPAPATVRDAASAALQALGVGLLPSAAPAAPFDAVGRVAVETGFSSAQASVLLGAAPLTGGGGPGGVQPPLLAFDTQTGFAVSGASVVRVAVNPRMGKAVVTRGDGLREPVLVQFNPRTHASSSVALQFPDGWGTVVAALQGYVGTIVIDSYGNNNYGVANVSYVPSANNWRWSDYQQQQRYLDRLRATVAAAAQFGVFRVEGTKDVRGRQAKEFADKIRVLKSIDPTLGLYAAYAYAEADLIDDVRSVRSFMHDDLEADLFDVALLAGALTGKPPGAVERILPFCPMLSQGWSLLRVRDVRLPPPVTAARGDLRPALWTSFGPDGMSVIISALRSGELI
jgi:hypothetical protein